MTAKSKLSNLKILIVDDEPDSVLVASDLLSFYGATVFTADNGRTALELIDSEKPDLVLSDISMPELDGWTLIRIIRNNPETAELPVLALTAHAMPDDVDRGLALGFTSYLTKPFNMMTLVNDILQRVPSLAAEK